MSCFARLPESIRDLARKTYRFWRDNPQHVRELDWHTQLEAIGADQANKLRAEGQFGDLAESDPGAEISVEPYEDNGEEQEKED